MLGFVKDVRVYDFLSLISRFFLKNFKISTTFLGDFARIGEGKTEITTGLFFFLPFLEITSLMI